MNENKVSMLATSETWIEGEAIRQLERVATLNGMVKVVGLPDIHPGKGSPIGAAMLSEAEFYPYLVGSDVGCGMALFATEITVAKAKPEKWFKKLNGVDKTWHGNAARWLEEHGVYPGFLEAVGTIGHGNHFAEFIRIDDVKDERTFERLGLLENIMYLLVHSGSRGLGDVLLRDHVSSFRDGSLKANSKEADKYLRRHNNALLWAKANRELIAHRLLEQFDSSYTRLVDLCHNSITQIDTGASIQYLHRKGAAPSDGGLAIIPGSRATLSYLVMPTDDQKLSLWSIAHGAGRKWKRSDCKVRLRDRYTVDSFIKTKLGSFVICDDKDILYEEAPQAYKDIETIIHDMVSFSMISVIASLKPVLTYKGRER